MSEFRPIVVATALLFAPISSWAQDRTDQTSPVRITITKLDCARLVQHQPDDDVTFRPGTDNVRGQPVAPADLPGSGGAALPSLLPDVLEIPIDIKPLQGRGYATHGLADAVTGLGIVRYDLLKGTFTFNGEPMGDPDLRALSEACAKRGVR